MTPEETIHCSHGRIHRLCPDCQAERDQEEEAKARTHAMLLGLAQQAITKETAVCPGCGLLEVHKMCPAHGTPIYMNPEHESWGSISGIINQRVQAETAALRSELERVKARLLTAAGDDLCRLSQEEIKAMSLGAVKIPPKEEFLASCERFHSQVAGEVGVMGNCLTLAQLIAECEQLRTRAESAEAERERLRKVISDAADALDCDDAGNLVGAAERTYEFVNTLLEQASELRQQLAALQPKQPKGRDSLDGTGNPSPAPGPSL